MAFLLDDVFLAPFRGILWIAKQVHSAAQQDQENEIERLHQRLRELYMMVETGEIGDSEFVANEKQILDRLDELDNRHSSEK